MKSVAFFLFLGVVGLIGLAQADVDYCSPDLCDKGTKHIACKHSGDFAKTCPKEKDIITLTDELKKFIVKLHNTLRNNLAGGGEKPFKPATRMASMKWDDELAKLATLHVKGCEFEHDECHNTKSYKYSGQNLAQTWFDYDIADKDNIEDMIKSWWDEHKNANLDVIEKYPRTWDKDEIGHFTAMIRDSNPGVGCAVLNFVDEAEAMNSTLLTCNYGTTNIINKPVYDFDGKTASKCKTGTHPDFKNLCSNKESY